MAEDCVVLLRSTNIQDGRLDFSDVQIVPRGIVANDQLVNRDDVVVCMSNGSKALVGKSAPLKSTLSSETTVGAFCSVFHPLPHVCASFVSHVFRCEQFRKNIDAVLAGSAINNLRNSHVEAFPCLIPECTEQRRIAAVLDTADEAIAKTEVVIAKLKQVRTGLLHDLLTRGLDEHGQLRDPIAHPEQFKDSPLGRIPKEWMIEPLDSCCSDVVDCPHSTPNYLDNGVLVARTMHIRDGSYDEQASSRVTEMEYEERVVRLEPQPGDIVFTREAPVGEAFVIPAGMRICLGQRVMLLRPHTRKLLGAYLVAQIYSGAVRTRVDALIGGTTNPHLNVAEVRAFTIPLPPVREQEMIVSFGATYDSLLTLEMSRVTKLVQVKSGLMSDLLTGRVRVPHDPRMELL
jgi:type I restriction enzyme S subunit